MNIEFTELTWEDFSFWIDNDEAITNKIKELIVGIAKDPFKGIGKQEPLKFGLRGYWSRRISGEHRLVYKVIGSKGIDQKCIIIQCRFHYDDK
jgi:toxin YoeB